MRKAYILLLVFALASCNDDCDHGFSHSTPISQILVGSWYEETFNEEDTYSASGTFYGKFCNTMLQGEGNGRYYIDSDNNRLTWSYSVNGSSRTDDWKLTNVSELQFTMSSDIAILTYGKIVDTFEMAGGDTKQISFNKETVRGYESKNTNIATVTTDGIITATGEKGTTYIKIQLSSSNVWAKVVVGDNHPDLWIDYSSLLGSNYSDMKELLGTPTKSQDFGNYTCYSYLTTAHNILDYINVYIHNNNHSINQIDLHIRDGVTQEEILSYMNSQYYRMEGTYANQYHYSTSSQIELSRAAYVYDTEKKAVMIISGEDYMYQVGLLFWPNLTSMFGLSKTDVTNEMKNRGYAFLQSFDSYSINGSDGYIITGSDFSTAVEFVFNPDNVVSEFWIYLSPSADQEEILKYLRTKYKEATEEYVASYGFIFYNEQKTLKLVYKAYDNTVVFTDLTKKAVSRVILGKYWKGLGMTTNELAGMFGDPYLMRNNDQGNLQYFYAIVNDYITSITFNFNKKQEVNLINVFLRDEVNSEVVKDYLNTLYTFQEEVSTEQGPVMWWIDAKKEEDANMKIGFYTDYGVVVYKPSVEEAEPEPVEGVIPDYSTLINKTVAQVKTLLGEPEREMAGSYVYTPSGHEFVKRFFVRFDGNPITDTSLVTNISVTLQENHNEDKVLEYLNGVYSPASEYTTSFAYGYKTKDGSVLIQYTPSSNTISYIKSFGG